MKSSRKRSNSNSGGGSGGCGRRGSPWRWAGFAALALALGEPTGVIANTASKSEAGVAYTSSDAALLVRQLLALDKQAALRSEQDRLARIVAAFDGGPVQAPSSAAGARQPSHAAAERVQIRAIYGVGSDLVAELRINGNRVRYRGGSRWPLDQPRGPATYALIDIDHHCVRVRGRGNIRRVCLGGEGAAP